jgi:hypothetical protein
VVVTAAFVVVVVVVEVTFLAAVVGVVFVVTAGFVVTEGLVVIEGLVVVVGFVVTAGLVVTDGFVVIGFVVVAGFVVDVSVGFVVVPVVNTGRLVDVFGAKAPAPPDTPAPPEDVIELEPPEPPADVMDEESLPVRDGALFKLRMTLSNGARSRPLASGSCLLEVRFFRIAMFYPVFFTNEVKPEMLLTGLSFAVLANVLAGATVVGFLTGGAF